MRPVKVLQVATIMNRGGLETMLMNYYRKTDQTKVKFDFMVHRPERGAYDEEIESLGGKIYRMPPIHPGNFFGKNGYFGRLRRFFDEHKEYGIVHSHLDALSCFVLSAAKTGGVPVRIAHSHSTNYASNGLRKMFKTLSRARLRKEGLCTNFFACSVEAGNFLFGEDIAASGNFKVVKNAIDTGRFKFDIAVRQKIRGQLGVGEEFIIGHVGRFDFPKNHGFLIEIFYEVLKSEPNSRLLLVGDGQLRPDIENRIKELNISDKVIFTGAAPNVNELLSAMDVFLFPSLFEGLPVAIVEAQAAGLPIIISSEVSREAAMTDLTTYTPLDGGAVLWAEKVLSRKNFPRSAYSGINNEKVRSVCGIEESVKWLQEFYLRKAPGL